MRFHATAVFLCVLPSGLPAVAADIGPDVQRLQIQRDQQQMELRLKMQQQNERAVRPALDPEAARGRAQLERDQLQRQQQLFEEQSRALIAPPDAGDQASSVRRDMQRERAAQSGAEQSRRFEIERQAAP